MNEVVPASILIETAVKYAQAIVENSPDAVQATKRGLMTSLQHGGVEEAYLAAAWSPEAKQAYDGENIKVHETRKHYPFADLGKRRRA